MCKIKFDPNIVGVNVSTDEYSKSKFISLSESIKGEFNIQIFTNETVYGQLELLI